MIKNCFPNSWTRGLEPWAMILETWALSHEPLAIQNRAMNWSIMHNSSFLTTRFATYSPPVFERLLLVKQHSNNLLIIILQKGRPTCVLKIQIGHPTFRKMPNSSTNNSANMFEANAIIFQNKKFMSLRPWAMCHEPCLCERIGQTLVMEADSWLSFSWWAICSSCGAVCSLPLQPELPWTLLC